MPIYEYRCTSCGHQEEFLRKVSAAPLTQCPKCGQETFSKMLSAAGFQLKGSGWYATDFKSPAKAAATDAKADAKADAKPDAKPATSSDASTSAAAPAAPAPAAPASPAKPA